MHAVSLRSNDPLIPSTICRCLIRVRPAIEHQRHAIRHPLGKSRGNCLIRRLAGIRARPYVHGLLWRYGRPLGLPLSPGRKGRPPSRRRCFLPVLTAIDQHLGNWARPRPDRYRNGAWCLCAPLRAPLFTRVSCAAMRRPCAARAPLRAQRVILSAHRLGWLDLG
jgi:hypothetical protein